jgi:PHD/YefM family antitoxin component YafN of YafNO toxin-antitoxin module
MRDLQEHNQILITNNGRGEAVLIGVEDYAEYEEFLHIRYIKEKLSEAENAENDPSTKWLSKDDFFAYARSKL